MKETLGLLTVLLTFAGYGDYLFKVLRNRAKPHLYTWILWSLIAAITTVAQIIAGAGPGAWPTGAATFICLLIAFFSLTRGEKTITFFDRRALFCGLSAIPLWIFLKDPLYAVLMVCLITFFGFLPTVRKAWTDPYHEPVFLYALNSVKFGLALLAIEKMNLVTALFPALVGLMDLSFVTLLLIRRRKSRKIESDMQSKEPAL